MLYHIHMVYPNSEDTILNSRFAGHDTGLTNDTPLPC